MATRYEWDSKKSKRNGRVHGISFEQAVEIFGDPNIVVRENVHVRDELRMEAIGMTRGLTLLVVIFVDRSDPEVEIIRIISARKAEYYEQCAYEDQFG